MQQKPTTRRARFVPRSRPLDGLVAVALLLVLAGQYGVPGFANATRGLSVLLVLAGYVSTCSIVRASEQNEQSGFMAILGAWWSRLRQVWPSLLCVIAFAATLCAAIDGSLLAAMRPDVLPSLAMISNWTDLARNVAPGSSPSPIGNMWFVGIAMQLYAIWAVIVVLLLKAGKVWARRISMILAALATLWLVLSCALGANLIRVTLATDTRAFSFLYGTWLAFAFPLGKVPVVGKDLLIKAVDEPGPRRRRRRRYQATAAANALGIIAFVAICALVVLLPTGGTLLYGVVAAVISFLTVLLLATLLAPGNLLGRLLSTPPFVYVGTRAMAIYLWSYPFLRLVTASRQTTPWYLLLASFAATVAAAEITYRLVELPFSETRSRAQAQHVATYRLVTTGLVIVVASAFGARALLTIPSETATPMESPNARTASESHPVATDATATSESSTQNGVSDSSSTTDDDASAKSVQKLVDDDTIIYAPTSEKKSGKYDPVLIGDSVPGDCDWARLPDALIDSYIGRRPDQALEVAKGYMDQDAVGKVVILACFSNVTPTADQLDAFAELFGDERSIYLVGTVNPDGFMDEANAALQEACERNDNMHYIDWPAVEKGHDKEYLWDDVTHVRPEGGIAYVNMVVDAIAQDLLDAGATTE